MVTLLVLFGNFYVQKHVLGGGDREGAKSGGRVTPAKSKKKAA